MKVIKRDGRVVVFDKDKITNAIQAAFKSVYGEITEEQLNKCIEIADSIEKPDKDVSVEEIQDAVEKKLMASQYKDIAKAYILYRNNRTIERNKKSKLTKNITKRIKLTNVENQNANVDEKSFGGKIGAVNSDIMKEYALYNCMSKKSRENHLNNEIYIHDLDSYAIGNHNCITIPFDDLLEKGFNTRQTDVRPANSINTAFQLVAVIFQLQSLQQFGGVSASHLDWTMLPYVRKSFYKHFKDGLKYLLNYDVLSMEYHNADLMDLNDREIDITTISIEDSSYKSEPIAYQYAMDMTEKELKQAVEGMYHNLNTLQSRSGNQLN